MKLGYIQQRGESRYLVRWRVKDDATGKSRQTSKTVEGDYGKALAFLADKLNNPNPAPAIPERTFGDYAKTEWSRYTKERWKASTQVTQGSFVKKHIVPYFETMILSKIRPRDIEAFHAALVEKKLGPKTRRLMHSILTKMFAFAVDDLELIEKSPVKKGLAPRVAKVEKPALTEEQLVELFKVVPVKLKAFYFTLALTGIRTGEALGLKWSDVDLANRELHIQRAIYRGKETTPKTSSSIRRRPLAPELCQSLLNHKTMAVFRKPEHYVFASSSGRPLNPDLLREALQTALKGIGVTFDQARADGLHLLRHSSGSIVYRHTGGNVKETQAWLGHTNSRVTLDTYTHLANDQEQKTALQPEQAIFARPETQAPAN